jgi:hypothetical protein
MDLSGLSVRQWENNVNDTGKSVPFPGHSASLVKQGNNKELQGLHQYLDTMKEKQKRVIGYPPH